MKHALLLMLFLAFLLVQCGLINTNKQKENIVTETPPVKTAEQMAAEEKLRQDSIENAVFELMQKTAFGELTFGMEKEQVEKLNEKRQLIGNYPYNFSHSFNGKNQLYKVRLNSDGVKTIQFDTSLKSNYNNLLQIIKTKYGDPGLNRNYPSIFEVQESKKFEMNNWELGTKQIHLGLQENKVNSYSVYCEIIDTNMDKLEKQRLSNSKNKSIIQASEKF